MTRAALVVSALVLVLAPALARADAIGPAPVAEHCPRGSVSEVANEMRHGQFAYCAPAAAAPDPACWDGHAREIVELSIAERVVWPSSGHGAPAPTEPSERLAEVTGRCDAQGDETPITARPIGRERRFSMSGPSIEDVPAGCHRIEVWVLDPSVHCGAPPAPTEQPAPPPPVDPEASAVVAIEAPPPVAAAPVEEAPRVAPRATAEAASAGCACRVSASREGETGVLVLVAAVACTTTVRRRRRGVGG